MPSEFFLSLFTVDLFIVSVWNAKGNRKICFLPVFTTYLLVSISSRYDYKNLLLCLLQGQDTSELPQILELFLFFNGEF